ncbi:hypothetical protein GAY30_27300 [Azospirillum brasilense]|nr:hypothetical protein [Azospirillum brasilense]NUB35702.1 hypothetical protein [Azospirillum brasilense]RIV96736.1 hypothetical protein D2T81_30775 [Azospirillum brasilense]
MRYLARRPAAILRGMTDATPQPDRINLPDHAAPKRPRTAYDEQAVAAILGAVSGGTSLRRACTAQGIDHSTFLRWVRDDEPVGLANQYARAREQQAHALADGIVDIAMDETAKADPNLLRVRLDAAKWAAARILPKVYGDRIDVNQHHTGNVQVGWVIDLSPAGPVIEGEGATVIEGRTSADE